jgi:putative flippase GtrA
MRFLRFCIVGLAGFIVEAVVLTVATNACDVGPFWARGISFPVAVSVTFTLNRQWSFTDADQQPIVNAFVAYLGVQSTGLLCNLLIYSAAITLLPALFNAPITALIIASGAALIVNYVGSRRLVFKPVRALATCSDASLPGIGPDHQDPKQPPRSGGH